MLLQKRCPEGHRRVPGVHRAGWRRIANENADPEHLCIVLLVQSDQIKHSFMGYMNHMIVCNLTLTISLAWN
jgi:hypothetical protein